MKDWCEGNCDSANNGRSLNVRMYEKLPPYHFTFQQLQRSKEVINLCSGICHKESCTLLYLISDSYVLLPAYCASLPDILHLRTKLLGGKLCTKMV